MNRHDIALMIAGVIGSGAIVHGVLTQRHIIEPFQGLAAARISRMVQGSCPFSSSSAHSTGSSGGSPC